MRVRGPAPDRRAVSERRRDRVRPRHVPDRRSGGRSATGAARADASTGGSQTSTHLRSPRLHVLQGPLQEAALEACRSLWVHSGARPSRCRDSRLCTGRRRAGCSGTRTTSSGRSASPAPRSSGPARHPHGSVRSRRTTRRCQARRRFPRRCGRRWRSRWAGSWCCSLCGGREWEGVREPRAGRRRLRGGGGQREALRKILVRSRSAASARGGTTRGGDTHAVHVAAGHEHGHAARQPQRRRYSPAQRGCLTLRDARWTHLPGCALIRSWRPLARHTRCCSTRSG